jgi:hypothetical protein
LNTPKSEAAVVAPWSSVPGIQIFFNFFLVFLGS